MPIDLNKAFTKENIYLYRSINEPIRQGLSWDEIWKGHDRGLVNCWEVGRGLSKSDPGLAEKARNNELPVLGWKGGVEKSLKNKEKYGTLHYLAEWQGLRGEDLNINTGQEVVHVCTKTNMRVTFTSDSNKYCNG